MVYFEEFEHLDNFYADVPRTFRNERLLLENKVISFKRDAV